MKKIQVFNLKRYRVDITMHEYGYVDVLAKNKKDALIKAQEASDNGNFIGNNSDAEIGTVTLNQ